MFDIAEHSGKQALGTGTLFRRATPGPELDLVSAFRESLLADRKSAGSAVTLFVEPRVHGRYPDLVAVFWDPVRASRWPQSRAQLTVDDLKYVHRLHRATRISIDELVIDLGRVRAERLVQRLLEADVARLSGWNLVRRCLRDVFAVTRVLAFEAKISDWRNGLDQAFWNSWFTSETFLLLPPSASGSSLLLERATALGVGIIVSGQQLKRPLVRPRADRVPKSYASWLFNEWVWRRELNANLEHGKRAA